MACRIKEGKFTHKFARGTEWESRCTSWYTFSSPWR